MVKISNNIGKKVIDLKEAHIRWNCELAEKGEYFMEDSKIIYNFFISYRNPQKILNQILNQAQLSDFAPTLDGGIIAKGKVKNSVNEYILASYEANRKIQSLDFSFTKLPVLVDTNLSNNYKKVGKIEDYILKFIE